MENNAEMINELTKLCQEMKRISEKFGVDINGACYKEYGVTLFSEVDNTYMHVNDTGLIGYKPIAKSERKAAV